MLGFIIFLSLVISLTVVIVPLIGQAKAYKKMGLPGWAVIIPIYDRYVLFKLFYGKGWKLIYEWIPIYGTFVKISLSIRIAKSFDEDGSFGWGLGLMGWLFWMILGFNEDRFNGPVADVVGNWLKKILSESLNGFNTQQTTDNNGSVIRKTCPFCGAPMEEDDAFCMKCGKKVD